MRKHLQVLIALVMMMGLAACGSQAADQEPTPEEAALAENAQQVVITASNWQFDQQEYRVKKGQPVTVTLKNAQGIHGISIQGHKAKLEGKKLSTTFVPEKAGEYPIICTIPCGTDHIKMRAIFVVEE